MKVLFVGNHSCSNRGDAAITRGLLEYFKKYDIEQEVYSRFPNGASEILGTEVLADPTDISPSPKSFIKKIVDKIAWKLNFDPETLLLIGSHYVPFLKNFVSSDIKKMLEATKQGDAVVQVGGSFFVDLYGMSQYRLLACAILTKTPAVLIGHSLGPFEGWQYSKVAGWCLRRATSIVVRDDVSIKLVEEKFPDLKYISGADTAWLVPSQPAEHRENVVAITVRELAPFDKRLGIAQAEYEDKMANLVEWLVGRGLKVRFFSTCTSFDNYHKDDRKVAQSIYEQLPVTIKDQVTVVWDELDDVQLGQELAKCKFTIGTRLHSTIISMNFGVPAIAIGYEHKSQGLYSAMGLSDFIIDLEGFDLDALKRQAVQLDENNEELTERFSQAVAKQRTIAVTACDEALKGILGESKTHVHEYAANGN